MTDTHWGAIGGFVYDQDSQYPVATIKASNEVIASIVSDHNANLGVEGLTPDIVAEMVEALSAFTTEPEDSGYRGGAISGEHECSYCGRLSPLGTPISHRGTCLISKGRAILAKLQPVCATCGGEETTIMWNTDPSQGPPQALIPCPDCAKVIS